MAGVIPAIGPVIAGGTLAAMLANAAGGAAIGGVLGTLTGESYPQEEANYYQAEFEAGRTIVTVDAGNRRTDAMSVIALNGGYNLDTQASRPTATTATGQTRVTSATAAGAAPGPLLADSPAETSAYPGLRLRRFSLLNGACQRLAAVRVRPADSVVSILARGRRQTTQDGQRITFVHEIEALVEEEPDVEILVPDEDPLEFRARGWETPRGLF